MKIGKLNLFSYFHFQIENEKWKSPSDFRFPFSNQKRKSELWNSTRTNQDHNILYQVCVFRTDRKNKMATRPLIGWDIFDFSSETPERNSTKLDRTQDPNVLYEVCVFRPIRKKQDGRPCLWLAETFSSSLLKPLNGIQQTWQEARFQRPLPSLWFWDRLEKNQRAAPASDWLRHFLLNSVKRFQRRSLCFSSLSGKRDGRPGLWLNSTRLDRRQELNILYQVCVFRADRKNKMAALASDWLRHVRLVLWNRGRAFNETWQGARSQRTNFVFFGPIGNSRWPPWPLIGWQFFDFSTETTEWN